MAAGLGYKEFATGDVLTAADANGYLASQVVMVFASAAARTSAIASPQEGMISYLKDTNSTEYYSGSAWAAIGGGGGGGGKVLQVVSASTTTVTSVTGTTLTDTNITASITPSASTSKVLVLVSATTQMLGSGSVNQVGMGMNLLRGSTVIFDDNASGEGWYITTGYTGYHQLSGIQTINYLDSPATTSSTTYKIQIRANASANTAKTSDNSRNSSIILLEIGA